MTVDMSTTGARGERLQSAGERFAARQASVAGFLTRLIAPGLKAILSRIDAGLKAGRLRAHLPDGRTRALGGHAPGFEAEITLYDWRSLLRLATGGVIGFYQGYEAGEWDSPDKASLFALFSANARSLGGTARASGPLKWAGRIKHGLNRNSRTGAARNISAHYDLGNDFYASWLDERMIYSSALNVANGNLQQGQTRKMERLAARLGNPDTVLEIGCGWGALAQHLAKRGAQVTAISLSGEQLAWARDRTSPRIEYRKLDYRDVSGRYDAIACVEMVEALGREYWPAFMDSLERNLRPGGRAAVQFISMADDLFETYASHVDFIQAYIFPGGLLIKASEFRTLAQQRGFEWRDEERFGHDYALTLKIWHDRFDRAVNEGRLPTGFDARFVRLWRFYLDYCEGGFRGGNIDVHQVTLVKK